MMRGSFPRHRRRLAASLCAATIIGGCGGGAKVETARSPDGEALKHVERLFHAKTALMDDWTHVRLKARTQWRLAAVGGEVAIRAIAHDSASGLIQRNHVPVDNCRVIRWRWRVDAVQPSADLRRKARDDVAAALFVFFGDPGTPSAPARVPTLRYVWSNAKVAQAEVIANPYLPETVKNIVIRAGDAPLGSWRVEQRDFLRDYERAFGGPPTHDVEAIGLFTDNDQTGERVRAYYSWAEVGCERPISMFDAFG